MSRFASYSSALAWLYARNQFTIKLGLEAPRRLLEAVGNPERGGVFLHVAGTNGKGSVCAALAAMLPALGVRRVGLYTSPHLVSFRERLRVDGEPVPAAFVTGWLNRHVAVLEALDSTYFEIVTAMALAWFRERECGAVVLETGLGGRLDATNVVAPRVSAITSIAMDHAALLGDTLEAVQREKLGIVKPGVSLVVDEARAPLALAAGQAARAAGAPFRNLAGNLEASGGEWALRGEFRTYRLPVDLRAEDYQIRNAALAVLALEAFHGKALPPEAAWLPALRAARMPGRMQRVESPDHVPVLLDGAHNPAAAEALAGHLRRHAIGRRTRIFFSCMRDKEYVPVLRALCSLSHDIVFVDLSRLYPRSLPAESLRAALAGFGDVRLRVIEPVPAAVEALLRSDSGADSALFCGSLYLIGEMMPMLAAWYGGLEEPARLKLEDGAD